MTNRENNIVIKVKLSNQELELYTYEGEYHNLMMLLYDRLFPEDFGECKGIGRCGTCHVKILNPSEELLIKQGNENSTLAKHGKNASDSRLACQIVINKNLNGLTIKIES